MEGKFEGESVGAVVEGSEDGRFVGSLIEGKKEGSLTLGSKVGE